MTLPHPCILNTAVCIDISKNSIDNLTSQRFNKKLCILNQVSLHFDRMEKYFPQLQ